MIFTENMTKEERINLIRFGPQVIAKDEKIAVNLLKKYKPSVNLNLFKIEAKRLDLTAEKQKYK